MLSILNSNYFDLFYFTNIPGTTIPGITFGNIRSEQVLNFFGDCVILAAVFAFYLIGL